MSKTSYTEDQVKKIIKNLYLEKKRVEELKNDIDNISKQNKLLEEQAKIAEERPPLLSANDPSDGDQIDRIVIEKNQECIPS